MKRVTPDEAWKLLEQGWVYVDVRSVPEFQEGHPVGAFNVPLMHRGPAGMSPNPRFAEVMEANFHKDQKMVVACKSGGRSARAAQLLASRGFVNIADMRGGFGGEIDPAGRVTCEGWQARGLPVETEAQEGHSYEELEAKSR